jgi:hypothetical protein
MSKVFEIRDPDTGAMIERVERKDLPPAASCRDVSAFPLHGASVECAKKRGRGVGDGFEGRCTSLVRRSGGRLRHIGSGPNQRTSSISICSAS